MEDPLGQARIILYSRVARNSDGMSDSDYTGLFTRPAVLAIKDETAGGLAIRALNLACNKLLTQNIESASINRISDECGFEHVDQFIRQFQAATGWHPEEWRRCFGVSG